MRKMLHATCIALDGRGVLLLGPPGSGKSSLALQMIDMPGYGAGDRLLRARLVADDQVQVSLQQGELVATAPPSLAGLLEVRGLGLVRVEALASVTLALVVELSTPAATERLPEQQARELLGVSLPLIGLDASLPAAPARLRAAARTAVNAA
jgi:serine kinase of HPr protein (carbohydrate metabolism regulator)